MRRTSRARWSLLVFVTFPSRLDAERIGQELVRRRLAACAQVLGPVSSTYRWQGRTVRKREWLCLLKTRQDTYPELEEVIRVRHSYEVPEIVAVRIETGSADYLGWLDRETRRLHNSDT